MLPAPHAHRFNLADVLPSCLDSVLGDTNTLALQPVSKAVVLLVDGLGASNLQARSGHARTLAAGLSRHTTIGSGFPTTTAAALATLTTGQHPGEHGLVGYTALDVGSDRVVNQLNGWEESNLDPATWQRCPTVFERADRLDVRSFAIGAARFVDSGFTRAVLRGAEYLVAGTIAERLAEARRVLNGPHRSIVYVYVPELDQAAHKHGWESDVWIHLLEELDAAVREFAAQLRGDEGLLVTADHGVLDIPTHSHVLFERTSVLFDGIRHVAGEPRALQLYFEPDAPVASRESVIERWRDTESDRSWVATRSEAIAAGWFGPSVHPQVEGRIGDVIIAARKAIVYYDSQAASSSARAMVGQHGSLSPQETAVPLLRFGAYARR